MGTLWPPMIRFKLLLSVFAPIERASSTFEETNPLQSLADNDGHINAISKKAIVPISYNLVQNRVCFYEGLLLEAEKSLEQWRLLFHYKGFCWP